MPRAGRGSARNRRHRGTEDETRLTQAVREKMLRDKQRPPRTGGRLLTIAWTRCLGIRDPTQREAPALGNPFRKMTRTFLERRPLLLTPAAGLHALRHDLAEPELPACLGEGPLVLRLARREVRVCRRAESGNALARLFVHVVRARCAAGDEHPDRDDPSCFHATGEHAEVSNRITFGVECQADALRRPGIPRRDVALAPDPPSEKRQVYTSMSSRTLRWFVRLAQRRPCRQRTDVAAPIPGAAPVAEIG